MKQTIALFIAVSILLLCGCRHDKQSSTAIANLSITPMEAVRCMELDMTDTIPFSDGTLLGVQNEYFLSWPDISQFCPEVRRQLIRMAFGDSTSTDLRTTAERFLASTGFDEGDDWFGTERSRRIVDSLTMVPINSAIVRSTCSQDSNLLYFETTYESMLAAAAHGIYGIRTLLLDLGTGRTVELSDLLTDTAALGKVMICALDEIAVNREKSNTSECLFDEYSQRLPQPDGFFLDETRSVLTVYFNPYSVQSYACGMLFVEMPIHWLSKHIPLTPYGEELLCNKAHTSTASRGIAIAEHRAQ